MVVYVDVLFCLNIVLTYLILLATKHISHSKSNMLRLIIASIIGGLFSLYIFLPKQNFMLESLIKFVSSCVITITAFKPIKIKGYLRVVFSFYVVSFIYAGAMLCLWYLFKPNGMVINNGVVYFSISPIVLIVSTTACYLLLRVVQVFLKRENTYTEVKTVKLIHNNKTVFCKCMVDSGNTLCELISGHKVITVDKMTAENLFGTKAAEELLTLSVPAEFVKKFRVIPYKTLSSNSLMPAVNIDYAEIDETRINNVFVSITAVSFEGDFSGIISPEFIL